MSTWVSGPGPAEPDRTKIVTFYSHSGGAGRSCTVANIALILANSGNRVLVVDMDLDGPSLHRYLAAFILPGATTPPLRLDCKFAAEAGLVDFIGPVEDVVENPAPFAVSRDQLRGHNYDYVLIDSPAGVSDRVEQATSLLPDTLVIGYNLSSQAVEGGLQRARAVSRERGKSIRILPVPMLIHVGAHRIAERRRYDTRRQFAWLLEAMSEDDIPQYWNNAEIPYVSDYSVEQGLAVLDEPSDDRDALLNAYLRLATVITGGRLDQTIRLDPIPAGTLVSYRRSRPTALGEPNVIKVVHAAADRSWAEWAVDKLRGAHLAASRYRIDQFTADTIGNGDSVVIVLSKNLAAGSSSRVALRTISARLDNTSIVVLGLRIDNSDAARHLPEARKIDIRRLTEEGVHSALVSFFGPTPFTVTHIAEGRVTDSRYPGDYSLSKRKEIRNLPPRNPAFLGRDDILDRIRDHFTSADAAHPCVLTGPPGIGKSELAVEYAYRFTSQYDLVWILKAETRQSIQAALMELLSRRKVPRIGDAPASAINNLESDISTRWLLIYDGADRLEELTHLVAHAAHGHVLITSRGAPDSPAGRIPVDPFAPEESDGLVVGTVSKITRDLAAAVTKTVGRIPLTLNLAAAWIREVSRQLQSVGFAEPVANSDAVTEFIEQFHKKVAGDEEAQTGVAPDSLAVTVNILVELLERDEWAAAALRLLYACAFLSPTGISQELARSPKMLSYLRAAQEELADPLTFHNVLRSLSRHGFLPLNQPSQTRIRVHPLVLELLRSGLPEQACAEYQAAAGEILAAFAPPDGSDARHPQAPEYAELQAHIEPSGAISYVEEPVRRWLVNQIGYLWQTDTASAWETAANLGERILAEWAMRIPVADDDPLMLRLKTQLANVYRSRGDFARAYELDTVALIHQRKVLGRRHLRTLATARGYAADLRLLGDFENAELEDRSTWQLFRTTLGDDDALTVTAASNLGISQLLVGAAESALTRQWANLERSMRLAATRPEYGPWSLLHIGTYLRELGRYEESRDQLEEARRGFDRLVEDGVVPPNTLVVLRTTMGLAATFRRLGAPARGLTEQALRAYQDTYGPNHPEALACALSLAGDMASEGERDEACRQATESLEGFRRVFTDNHPFTQVCRVNLGIYAWASDDLGLAGQMSEQGFSALGSLLGSRHPWTLGAAVNRANVLVKLGLLDEAMRIEQRAVAAYRRRMGADHVFTTAAELNAEHTRLVTERAAGKRIRTEAFQRHYVELDVPPT